jgi:hypothetical protein
VRVISVAAHCAGQLKIPPAYSTCHSAKHETERLFNEKIHYEKLSSLRHFFLVIQCKCNRKSPFIRHGKPLFVRVSSELASFILLFHDVKTEIRLQRSNSVKQK